jgi:RimJ/RimL family protein N-acetyltransferase
MELPFVPLAGRFVTLEPFAPALKEEVRGAIDCDPDAWAILPTNPTGGRFEAWWSEVLAAPAEVCLAYAIRNRADGRVVGKSTFYTGLASQGGVEIGSTFLHPDVRSGPTNPETKFLMLRHAFASGAVRVQFRVDTRNQRSQAAVAKLGAVREGVLRKDRLTWTGYIRDTAHFSILESEWPAARARLLQRLDAFPN